MKKFIIPLLLTTVVLLDGGSANAASDAAPFVAQSKKNDATSSHKSFKPIVARSKKNDTSLPLRSLKPIPPRVVNREFFHVRSEKTKKGRKNKTIFSPQGLIATDTVVQSLVTGVPMPSTDKNFEGMHNPSEAVPPDTNGAAGPNHYVQIVNVAFQIWDKNGTSQFGPSDFSALWYGFGGMCEFTGGFDPIVLYDHLADRWLISTMASGGTGTNYQCIAVSQTGDPLGSWYRYQFSSPVVLDYSKFGVWPDGYYMSTNQFVWVWEPNLGLVETQHGAGVVVFERDKMLNNQPAQNVYFDLSLIDPCFFSLLPSDFDGPAPPAGTPNYFSTFDSMWSGCSLWSDHLKIWEFHVDWTAPEANSTFGIDGQPNTFLDTAPFDTSLDYIPQPGVASYYYLEPRVDRLMYRLQYRDFETYSTMVTNHTVNAGDGRAGIRWYELRNSGGDWSIYQQGTYAPADTENRWMGSIAMDGQGNIALGYSVSSSTVHPSIRYAGRLKDDPLGTLPQSEASIIEGTGSQLEPYNRWGDYSSMSVDPDGCTFWYTQEYYRTTTDTAPYYGRQPWRTRIASFQFPGCIPFNGTGVATLNVNKSGTGTGTVTSSPAGIDCGSDCSEQYYRATSVPLTAVPSAGSSFTGWVGAGCTGTGTCDVAVNTDTKIIAVFNPTTCSNLPVKIKDTTGYYSSLQDAYDAAANGDVIQVQGLDFIEDLNVHEDKSVTLQGGYDCNYTPNNWVRDTYVYGAIATSANAGPLTLGGFVLGKN